MNSKTLLSPPDDVSHQIVTAEEFILTNHKVNTPDCKYFILRPKPRPETQCVFSLVTNIYSVLQHSYGLRERDKKKLYSHN